MSELIDNIYDVEAIDKQKKAVADGITEIEAQIKKLNTVVEKAMGATRSAKTGEDLAKQQKIINDATVDSIAITKELANQQKQLEAIEAKRYAANSKVNQDLEKNKKLLAEQNKELKLQAVLNDENAGKLEKLKASNALLQMQKEKLKETDKDYLKTIESLNKQMDENQAMIDQTSNKLQKQKDNVGNYEESIKSAIKALMDEANERKENIKTLELAAKAEGASREEKQKAILALKENKSALEGINKELKIYGQNTEESSAGASELWTNFKNGELSAGGLAKGVANVGKQMFIAFISNPILLTIGAIAGAVMVLVKAFARNEEAMGKIKQVGGALSGVFGGLMNALKPVVDFIADKVVSGFEALGNIAEKTTGLISKGLKVLGFENASANVDKFTASVKENAKAGRDLATMQAEQIKNERELTRIQFEYLKEQEKFRQVRDDVSKSMDERIKANDALGASLLKQSEIEMGIFQQAKKIAEENIKINGSTAENLDQLAEAKANIADLEERINGFQSEQLVNAVGLRKEAEDAIKAQQEQTKSLVDQSEALLAQKEEEVDVYEDFVIEETEAEKKKFDQLEALNEAMIQSAIDKKRIEYEKKLVILRKESKNDEEFAAKKFELDKSLLQESIDNDTRALESSQLTGAKRLEIETKLADAQIALDNLVLDNFKGNEDEKLSKVLEVSGQISDAGIELLGSVADFQKQKSEERLEQLAKEQEASDDLYNRQQANLDNALMSDEQRAKMQQKIDEDKAKREEEIRKKEQAEKVKMAQWDKANDLATAIRGGAQAVIEAWGAGPILGPVMAAIVGAAALYNIGRIASTEIPAFATGTMDTGNTIGLWGEVRPEVAVTRTGDIMFAEQPTISKFDAGTRIFKSVEDFERNMSITQGKPFEFDYEEMGRHMPVSTMNIDENGLVNLIDRQGNRRTMINRKYSLR